MGLSPWEFTCSVCKKSYETHNGWLLHLLLPGHQELAKHKSRSWSESDKESVVVACSAESVEKDALTILNELSSIAEGTIVTDLILWTNRPRVAFIQFESKNKVADLIPEASQFVGLTLSTCHIQVKRATDLVELEWHDFFQYSGANRKQKACSEIYRTTNPKRQKTSPRKTVFLLDCPPFPKIAKVGMKKVLAAPVQAKIVNPSTPTTLRSQYCMIRDETAIPASDFAKMLRLVDTVGSVLNCHFPKCKLHLFRHWYLQTKNCGTNQLLIFLDLHGIWDKSWNFDVEEELSASYQGAGFQAAAEILEMGSNILFTKNLRKLDSFVAEKIGVNFELDTCGYHFYDENSGIVFGLFNQTSFILETQTSRLVKYLSSFDPRVIPLISLINYWAKLNKVCFAPNVVTDLRVPTIVGAEPTSLEWLVLFLLSRQRVIPSVREILENPHDKLMFQKQDIGFSIDMNFSKKWAEDHPSPDVNSHEYFRTIFAMARDFFHFYGYINPKTKILNTKDTELLEESQFYTARTRLTMYEQNLVKETFKKADMKHVMKGFKILHPLCVSCFLSFDSNSFAGVFQKMFKETNVKLRGKLKNSKPKPGMPVDLISLLLCDER